MFVTYVALQQSIDWLTFAHIETVHEIGDKQFKCEKCQFTTFSKRAISNYTMDVHEKKRTFICEECGYATKYWSLLKMHMDSVHKLGEKKFKCEDCDYAAYRKVNLKHHIGLCKGKKDNLKRDNV